MSNWYGGWFGDSTPAGGGSCDYPVASDVRSGITYSFGTLTGTLELPATSDVRFGIGYGASGTEFTGTLLVPSSGAPAGTLTHSPADVTRWLLCALGLATDPDDGSTWPGYATGEPSSPDNCITVYDTAGGDDGRSMVTGEVFGNNGIQVRIRSSTHTVGWQKADAIWTTLAEGVYDQTVTVGSTSYLIHCYTRIGDIIAIGKESPTSKRSIFTINCQITFRQLED